MSSKSTQIPGVVGRPDALVWVDPLQVRRPSSNPRTEAFTWDDLVASMQAQGFRMDGAISVYKAEDGVLELLDGQRRLSAVLELNDHQLKAGGFKSFRRTSPPTERENG
jgi:ParB-like nuclease domain